MKLIKTQFKDLIIIRHNVFKDHRGYFKEKFKKENLEKIINDKIEFCQENSVKSDLHVLRGLHFQNEPFAQSKLVSVQVGKILDVAVDIRKKSKNFGKVYKYILKDNLNNQLLIPRGFAHGFQCLSSDAIIYYKCDNYYASKDQHGIIYNDNILNIDWPIKKKIFISKKDKKLPNLADNRNFF